MPYEREGPVLRSLVLFGGHGSVGLLPLFPARSSGGGMSRKTKDSLTYLSKYHYTWNTNLEVLDDSVRLEYLPLKDAYVNLYKGDRVVVAEFSVHPQDSVDSIWVKVAHSQEVQGWVRNKELVRSFVPTDSISQFIHLFSDTHASYFVFIFALFVGVYLLRAFMKKRLQMVYFNDIDSVYPLFLCLLMAFSALQSTRRCRCLYPTPGSIFTSIPPCLRSRCLSFFRYS